MFSNIGQKVKKIAKLVFTVGTFVSAVGGIVMMATGDNGLFILLGLLVIGLGILGAWIAACLVYGFGELISTNTAIKEKLCGKDPEETAGPVSSVTVTDKPGVEGTCDICGAVNVEVHECVIQDQLGTRYRTACRDCMAKTGAKAK